MSSRHQMTPEVFNRIGSKVTPPSDPKSYSELHLPSDAIHGIQYLTEKGTLIALGVLIN